MNKYPVIVALDDMELAQALAIARALRGSVWGFKVHDLVIREGFGVIKKLKRYGKVFVDLKLHDIPTTVEHEVKALLGYGADIVSIHASGGKDMVGAAVRAGGSHIAAVTTLSSMTGDSRKMLQLASLARAAGVTALICPARDVGAMRRIAKTSLLITPGIRSLHEEKHDQRRTASARAALLAGADLLVIGRPITQSPQPLQALEILF